MFRSHTRSVGVVCWIFRFAVYGAVAVALTGDSGELAAAVGNAEANTLHVNFVRLGCRGRVWGVNAGVGRDGHGRRLEMFVELGPLPQTPLLATLFGRLFHVFGPLLRDFVVDGRIDQLHVSVALDNPSVSIGSRRGRCFSVCRGSVWRRRCRRLSPRARAVQNQRAIVENLASATTRSAIGSATVRRPVCASATITSSGISGKIRSDTKLTIAHTEGRLLALASLLALFGKVDFAYESVSGKW